MSIIVPIILMIMNFVIVGIMLSMRHKESPRRWALAVVALIGIADFVYGSYLLYIGIRG